VNARTAKLLANYAKESGRTRRDIKDWWKSLVEEDKDRARKGMTVFIKKCRTDKKTNPGGGDHK